MRNSLPRTSHFSSRQWTWQTPQPVKDKLVFIVIDESEVDKKKFINVLTGDVDAPEKTYLVDCLVTETVNQSIICTKLNDCLKKIDIPQNNFLLLLSDTATYMTAATTTLKVLYLRMLHIACLVHLLHNCAEKVCSSFLEVDTLIAHVKAVTVKNKTRRDLFKKIGSPLEPVVTRWGSWLNAAQYYVTHLVEVHAIVDSFEGDRLLVKRAKDAVNDKDVAASLVKIKCDYDCLAKLIGKLSLQNSTSQKCTKLWPVSLSFIFTFYCLAL